MTDGTISAVATTDSIYVVQAGDSLAKIAQHFYGNAARYPDIAARNNVAANSIVYIGQRLIIPAGTASSTDKSIDPPPSYYAPTSPGGSAPVEYDGQTIETVTTTAARIRFWEDWRFWVLAGGAAAAIWYLNRRN